MHKLTFILLIILLTLTGHAVAESKKIVKWVDSKGVTHYGDKLPAQEVGRNNIEMRDSGVVIKKNVMADHKMQVLNLEHEQKRIAQEKADKVLLASYTKAEEIDLACDRNLQMDQASMQSLMQQKLNTANRTARNNKTAQGFTDKNKPLPAYLSDELKQSKLESERLIKQIAERKISMDATRKRYADEKQRFNLLKKVNLDTTETAAVGSP